MLTAMTLSQAIVILGVTPGQSRAELKRVWRGRAKALHPDRGGSPEAFIQAQQAYEIVCKSLIDGQVPEPVILPPVPDPPPAAYVPDSDPNNFDTWATGSRAYETPEPDTGKFPWFIPVLIGLAQVVVWWRLYSGENSSFVGKVSDAWSAATSAPAAFLAATVIVWGARVQGSPKWGLWVAVPVGIAALVISSGWIWIAAAGLSTIALAIDYFRR